MTDLISRQAAIDEVNSETVSTNPEHFKSSEKFIKFMDDDDIASFGKWQWANGFNTALTATTIQLKKLPSAQPSEIQDILEYLDTVLHPIISPDHWNVYSELYDMVSMLPSAQPERLTDDDFETIRIHLSAYKEKLCNQHRWKEAEEYQRLIGRFMAFASAQPELIRCCECKWWDNTSPASTMTLTFYKCRCFEKHYTQEDEFCSRAERRKEGDK